MEILYPILIYFGAVLAYFIVKSSSISRKIHDELNQNFIKKEADLKIRKLKFRRFQNHKTRKGKPSFLKPEILNQLKTNWQKTSAENNAQKKIAEQNELNFKQNNRNKDLQNEKTILSL